MFVEGQIHKHKWASMLSLCIGFVTMTFLSSLCQGQLDIEYICSRPSMSSCLFITIQKWNIAEASERIIFIRMQVSRPITKEVNDGQTVRERWFKLCGLSLSDLLGSMSTCVSQHNRSPNLDDQDFSVWNLMIIREFWSNYCVSSLYEPSDIT